MITLAMAGFCGFSPLPGACGIAVVSLSLLWAPSGRLRQLRRALKGQVALAVENSAPGLGGRDVSEPVRRSAQSRGGEPNVKLFYRRSSYPHKLPTLLNVEEVGRLLEMAPGPNQAALGTAYGAGLIKGVRGGQVRCETGSAAGAGPNGARPMRSARHDRRPPPNACRASAVVRRAPPPAQHRRRHRP